MRAPDWTEREVIMLTFEYDRLVDTGEMSCTAFDKMMSERLGRTPNAIFNKRKCCGLRKECKQPIVEDDIVSSNAELCPLCRIVLTKTWRVAGEMLLAASERLQLGR